MGNWTSSTIAEEEIVPRHQLSEEKQEEVEEFEAELMRKRQMRREILTAKKLEFETLKREIQELKEENLLLKQAAQTSSSMETNEQDMSGITETSSLIDKNRELQVMIAQMQVELQNLNTCMADFEKEREEYKAHISALKEVINISKKMLLIRESQLKELKEKVEAIEKSVSEKEINILSKDLRVEYEKQLQIMRNMRSVYEERQKSDYQEKQELKKVIEDLKRELEDEKKKNKEAEERIVELEEVNSNNYDEIKTLESNFGLAKAESRQYQAELAVINQLFSEILLGFNTSQDIDLDKLIRHLEDNHALLQNIASGEKSSESSFALPKVLLDLVHQVHNPNDQTIDDNRLQTIIEEADESQCSNKQINSVEEIVELLPKVWRVLIELLSHHKVPVNDLTKENDDPCYKTVQTPKGPSLVLSVSQTFIRLKDLILEKKSLEKETCHLKQLNTHLECRLSDQERRLQMVSSELNKTWHVVGKLQKQHQLLHTQEKILRYELAQKRKLLTTLKEELEDSRGKWQEAREKNSKTEKQWKQLRIEFASRRTSLLSDEFNNSQESGYSDEKCSSSSEDEPGYETDISEIGSKVNNACEEIDDVEENNEDLEDSKEAAGVTETDEEKLRLLAREERLQRLESQCGQLMTQVKNTGKKSVELSNKLDDIHSVYGQNGQGTSSSTDGGSDPGSSNLNG